MAEARVLSSSRDRVGESPVWSVAEQALYWIDIEGRHIHRYDWGTRIQKTWDTPERVGCIALTDRLGPAGGVVAAMETGVFLVEFMAPPQVKVKLLAGITHPRPNMRFNDGRCDRMGNFVFSTMDTGVPVQTIGRFHQLNAARSLAKIGELLHRPFSGLR